MKQMTGWAEPRSAISAPRVQKVDGFYHWESDTSLNSITWVMHDVEEFE